jgi:hypothetical protein
MNMTRKTVGYFEGTDPAVLTSLICDDCHTIPVSNGFDNYGQHVRLFNEENKVDLLIGYLHKIIAPPGADTQAQDIMQVCEIYQIPFLVVVPEDLHACARRHLEHWPEVVQLADPARLLEKAREILRRVP